MTAAAFTTAFLAEDFIMRRHTSFFESLANKAIHLVSDFLKDVLSSNKSLNAFMGVGLFLKHLEAADLCRVQLLTATVALLERAASGHHVTIQSHGLLVSEKGFRRFTGSLHGGIRYDGGTEGFNMRGDGGGEGYSHGRGCYRMNHNCRMPACTLMLSSSIGIPNDMTFLHTADWQIGKPFARIEDEQKRALVRQERIQVLSRIGVHALEQRAEFILVAGDLFDSPSPDKATVSATCAAIGALKVPVYAIPGNHDHGGPGSVWEQPFFIHERQALAPNLTPLLKAEALELNAVVLFPCPLLHRHETGDTTAWIRSADFSTYGTKPRIVIAHGTVQDFGPAGDDEDSSMPANYLDLGRMPTDELDYMALGDWHGMKRINDKAWYSGTPEPDRFPRGESNLPGRILSVNVERGQIPNVTPLSSARLHWHELEQTLSEESGLTALEKTLTNDLSLGTGQDLLRLTLKGSLGICALTELESLLATWQSRLLRLRLHQHITISPTEDEIATLTQRTDAPLVSRVAEKLLALSLNDGESAEIARSALRQLHEALR